LSHEIGQAESIAQSASSRVVAATCGNKKTEGTDHLRQYHNLRLQSIAPLRSLSLSWAGKKMGRDVNAKSAGIVSKRKASSYRSGRSPDWLKSKAKCLNKAFPQPG
jgi:hypothetical protein